MAGNMCDTCINYVWDEDDEDYYCCCDMDEDDYVRFLTDPQAVCPYYRLDDEYAIVRHQI